jgi:hypothetical protein
MAGAFLDQVLGVMAATQVDSRVYSQGGAHIMSISTPSGGLELILGTNSTFIRVRTFLPDQPDPDFSVAAWVNDGDPVVGLEDACEQAKRDPGALLPIQQETLAHIVAHFAGEGTEYAQSPLRRWAIGYLRDHGQYPDTDQI